MKTTFLIGLPRCGSLALSVIMNNHRCFAHHEGQDYGAMMNYDIKWTDTYAASAQLYAATSKKNYFCCDTSCGVELVKAAIEKTDFQIVYIYSSIDQCLDSYERMGIKLTVGMLKYQFRKTHLLLNTLKDLGIKILLVNKEDGESLNGSKFFTRSQLTEIANFVGAYDPKDNIENARMEHLRLCHMSMNPDRLRELIEEQKKVLIDNIPLLQHSVYII